MRDAPAMFFNVDSSSAVTVRPSPGAYTYYIKSIMLSSIMKRQPHARNSKHGQFMSLCSSFQFLGLPSKTKLRVN